MAPEVAEGASMPTGGNRRLFPIEAPVTGKYFHPAGLLFLKITKGELKN